MTEKTVINSKVLKSVSELLIIKIYLAKVTLKTDQVKYKLGSFYEKKLLLSKLYMIYYPEPDSHIRDKVKLVLDLQNYATKKKTDHATDVDTYDLAAE